MAKLAFCACSSFTALMLGLATPVYAHAATANDKAREPQQPESAVGEIVVTAQRREESLQKVPVAVTAIGPEQLLARGINGITGLQTQIQPGLVVQNFAGAVTTLTFQMRGIVSLVPQYGLNDQGVAIYVDGVPLGRALGNGIDVADLERVEVLRGPQGTLFGRTAEGGAIQYITKRPSGQFGGNLTAEYGNYNYYRSQGNLDLPAWGDLSVKLSGLYTKRNGYTKNPAPTGASTINPSDVKDFALNEQKAFRVGAQWDPSSNFKAFYAFDYSDTNYTNDYGIRTGSPAPVIPAFCGVAAFAATCANPATLAANLYPNRAPDPRRPEYADQTMYLPINHNSVRGHTAVLDWRASDNLSFKWISGYRTLHEVSSNNTGDILPFIQFAPSSAFAAVAAAAPTTPLAVSGNISTAAVNQHQFSTELQGFLDLDRFQMTFGLFYFTEKVNDKRDSLFGALYFYNGAGGLAPVVPEPFPLTVNPTTGLSSGYQVYDAEAKSYAAYAQATYTPPILDDRLKLTAGLRLNRDRKFFQRQVFSGANDGLTSVFERTRVDPALIAAFQATPDVNVYAKYSSAYRPGGVNIQNAVNLVPYSEEINKSFEAGFKSRLFDRRVRWNVSAFASQVSGQQIPAFNALPNNTTSQQTLNLPQAIKIKGIESELTVIPITGLALGLNYAYLDVNGPTQITAFGVTYNYRPPYAPRHQVVVTGDYTLPLAGDMKLNLHADYNYQSTLHVTGVIPVNTNAREADKRLHITNARLALEDIPLAGTRAQLAIFAKNIFNVKDYGFTFQADLPDPTAAAHPGGFGYFVDPRTFGVQLKLDF